jgi:hypothetical protein
VIRPAIPNYHCGPSQRWNSSWHAFGWSLCSRYPCKERSLEFGTNSCIGRQSQDRQDWPDPICCESSGAFIFSRSGDAFFSAVVSVSVRRVLGDLLPSGYKQGTLGIHCRSMSYFRAGSPAETWCSLSGGPGSKSVEGRVGERMGLVQAASDAWMGKPQSKKLVEWNSTLAYQMPIPSRKMSGHPLPSPLGSRTSNGRPHVAGSDRVGQKIFHAQSLPSWMVKKVAPTNDGRVWEMPPVPLSGSAGPRLLAFLVAFRTLCRLAL